MARRNDHTREELHENLIQAATDIIVAEGMENLTARKLATRIGYAVGTIYNVFQNLTDVILHVNARTMDMLADHVAAHRDNDLSGEEQLVAFAEAYIGFAQKHANLWAALFDIRYDTGAPLPGWMPEKSQALFDIIKTPFEGILADEKDRYQAAITIWGGVHGLSALSAQNRLRMISSDNLETMTDLLVRNYYRGFTAR